MSFHSIFILLSSSRSTQQHKEHHAREPLIANSGVGAGDGWCCRSPPRCFHGLSLCSPPPSGCCGRGKGAWIEELCRWEKSEEAVSYPWSEHWAARSFLSPPTDVLQLDAGVSPALLVQPLPAMGPLRSAGLSPDQGITQPLHCRLSIPYYFAGQSQNFQEKERDKKSQRLLGSRQAKSAVAYCRCLLAER